MKIKNNDKGSISVFVIVAFIFCMTIIVNIYWSNANHQVTVLQSQQRIQDMYGSDVDRMDEIHAEVGGTTGGGTTGGGTTGGNTTGGGTTTEPVVITSISDVTVIEGKTSTISINYTGNVKSRSFVSSDTSIATVNSAGLVTGVSSGTTTITVTFTGQDNKTATKSCRVTVIEKLEITDFKDITMALGNSTTLNLKYTGTSASIVYTSSNPSVATVTSDGRVTAVSIGTTTISVKITSRYGEEVTANCVASVQTAIAKVGSTFYTSINNAINSIGNTGTVIMCANTSETAVVPTAKNIEIDLSNTTIGNITNNGRLTVIGTGTIQGTTNAINNYGELNINGNATITSTTTENNSTIINQVGAKLSISNGSIQSNTSAAINNYGELIVSGSANISNKPAEISAIWNCENANITISGGTIAATEHTALYNYAGGTARITGGTMTSENYSVIENYGVLNIENQAGLSGTAATNSTIKNQAQGELTITGGTFNAAGESACVVYNNTNARAVITGGKFISENYGAINNYGNIEIRENAKIQHNATGRSTVWNRGALTMTGGEIAPTANLALYNYAEGTVKVTGGTIIGGTANYAVDNYGKFELSGTTTIKTLATFSAFYNETGGELIMTGGKISTDGWGLGVKVGSKATISGGEICSNNSGALSNYGETTIAGTAKIYNNADSSSAAYNRDTGKITMTGGTIEAKTGGGGLYVYAPNETNPGEVILSGGRITSVSGNAVNNKGKTTITGSVYVSTDATYATVYSTHILVISGGTITRTLSTGYGVYNEGGTVTRTGGTITGSTSGF